MAYILCKGADEVQSLFIRGGRPLAGEIAISGSKNAVLPMLAATVLFREPCCLYGCPDLTDVDAALEILTYLGAKVSRRGHRILVDPRPIHRWEIPGGLMCRMRGSVFFAGPLLARFGRCRLTQPGGCPLGARPVDFHRSGLEAMGAEPCADDPEVLCGTLKGAEICLPYPSVGATENLLMAALGAEGLTVIRNAAREPEIQCLCGFLRSGGCSIMGDGTSTVCILGGLPKSASYRVIPDRMEASTFACAAASAGGAVRLKNADPAHLESVLDTLEAAGCRVQSGDDEIFIQAESLRTPGEIVTGPYPAFPTDAQAPVMAALLRSEGITDVHETVFSHRMHHITGMRALGAVIECRESFARIRGVPCLHGAWVQAEDLRGGAALAVAALGADGITQIDGLPHLMRGYEDFAGKLRALGAEVMTA